MIMCDGLEPCKHKSESVTGCNRCAENGLFFASRREEMVREHIANTSIFVKMLNTIKFMFKWCFQ